MLWTGIIPLSHNSFIRLIFPHPKFTVRWYTREQLYRHEVPRARRRTGKMPDFRFFPGTSFRQNVRGMHAMQVFDGVGVENVLRSGCLGSLLGLGELAGGGGRGERPLEHPGIPRAQLAPQHRGRHRRGGSVCGRRRKWKGSVRSCSVQSAFGCCLLHHISHPHRMKCVTAATLALFALAASARAEKPCTVHDKGGTYYDLNRLSAK